MTLTQAAEFNYRNLCTETNTDPVEFENELLSAVDGTMFGADEQAVSIVVHALQQDDDTRVCPAYWGWLTDQLAQTAGLEAA